MTASEREAKLERIYANRFTRSEREIKRRLWKATIDGFFGRYIPPDGTVLELGAGYCDFINQIKAARRIAVDLNPETSRSAANGVEVHRIPLDQVGQAVPPNSVDLVFASNVLEHLRGPDVLLDVLNAVFVALKPNGRIVVLQPNIRAVGIAFWDFCDHTLPLTEKGMNEAFEVAGFDVVECRARFLPYTTKSRLPKSPGLIRLYLACPPLHWIFGGQMLVVGRKP
jgi:SAM-dependent methyltransferase